MRAIHSALSARRLEPPYRGVRTLQPDIFMPLDDDRYGGKPVLFQDADTSTAARSIGDPVAGIVDPRTGEVVTSTDTDAERPIRTERGLSFNGSQWLYQQDVPLPDVVIGVWAGIVDSITARGCMALRDTDGDPSLYIGTSSVTDEPYLIGIAVDGDNAAARWGNNFPARQRVVIVARWTLRPESGNPHVDGWITNGTSSAHDNNSITTTFSEGLTTDLTIGGIESDGSSLTMVGDMEVVYWHFLDIAQRPSDAQMVRERDYLARATGLM